MLNISTVSAQFLTNGPDGGNIIGFAQKDSTVFCVAGLWGPTNSTTLYSTIDNGSNWTNLTSESTPFEINAIAVAGDYIFLGTNSGVYRSDDNGVTWVNKGSDFPYGIAKLAVSGSTLIASGLSLWSSVNFGETWTDASYGLPIGVSIHCMASKNNEFYLGTDENGVFRSDDTGIFWEEVSNGLAYYYDGEWIPGVNPSIYSIGFNGTDMYIGTDGNQGIWKSTDNGDNWVHAGMETLNYRAIYSITGDGNNIYAASDSAGILRSNNSGTWIPSNTGIDIYVEARNLLLHGGKLFAGTWGGVYASNNGGENWEPKNKGISSQFLYYRWGFENLIKIDNSIFAGTIGGSVFRSTNEGADWESTNNGLPVNVIYAPMQAALYSSGNTLFTKNYFSTDQGNSWAPCTAPGLIGFDLVSGWIEHGGSLFSIKSGEGAGVFRSDDNGITWTEKANGLPYHEGGSFFTIDSDGNTLFIGTAWGLFYSSDNGENWHAGNVPGLNAWAFYFANFTYTTTTDIYGIFVGGDNRGIFVSDNDGANWTKVCDLLVHNFVHSGNSIYASGTNLELVSGEWLEMPRVFVSQDNGHTWSMIALNNVSTTAIAASGNYFFATTAAPDNSVYVTADQGENWVKIDDGLNSNVVINGLFVTDTKLYASTMGTSVWQRDLSGIFPPAQPDAIAGPTAPCVGTSQTYSVTNVPGVHYNWQLSAGWVITQGQGTNNVTVTVGSTPGVISVTPSTVMGTGLAQFLIAIPYMGPEAGVSMVADQQNVCSGTTVNFTATPTQGGASPSYQWLVNDVASGNSSSSFSYPPINNDRVKVLMTSSLECVSNSPASSNEVTTLVRPIPVVSWTAFEPDTMCRNWTPVLLTGATPAGGVYSGEGVSNNTFDPSAVSAGNHVIIYTFSDVNGCSNQVTVPMTINVCEGIEETHADWLVYPNPASEILTIKVQDNLSNVKVTLFNSMGIPVFENKNLKSTGTISIPVQDIPSGMYMLRIYADNETFVKSVIIQ